MTDYLACPNCGEPCTDGKLCNLTCRRELLEEQSRAWLQKHNVVSTPDTPQKVARFVADLDEARAKMNVLQVRNTQTWV